METWTAETLWNRISNDDAYAIRGVLALFKKQTADEQKHHTTRYSNNEGFSVRTVIAGTRIAKKAIARRYIGWTEVEIARKICRTHLEQLVRIANENAALNHANASFVHASGLNDQRVRKHGPYDLVFANILAPPLVALSQDIKMALDLGGVAILSGLLRTQERRVTAAYTSRGFRLEKRIHHDAWSALVLRRVG